MSIGTKWIRSTVSALCLSGTFYVILPSIPVCEAATVWNAVFPQYQENWPTAKRGIFAGQSLTIGLLQADYGTVHLFQKNTMAATSYISRFILNITFWGCASKSSQAILQKAQSKILRTITNTPWYVSNLTLHADLKIPYVREIITEKYIKHHQKLETHPNPLLHPLLDIGRPRRLKRTWYEVVEAPSLDEASSRHTRIATHSFCQSISI
jgi:hypothetical protein